MLISQNLFIFIHTLWLRLYSNRPARVKKKQIHSQFLVFLMILHCSYNKKLNTTKMPNNKSYKLMPNEKRDYNTGVSDGIKKF